MNKWLIHSLSLPFFLLTNVLFSIFAGSSTTSRWRNMRDRPSVKAWRQRRTCTWQATPSCTGCSTCITTGTTTLRWASHNCLWYLINLYKSFSFASSRSFSAYESNVYVQCFQVPPNFRYVVEQTLREFFRAIQGGKDAEQSWKKSIYKVISRLDDPVPEYFKSPNFLEQLEWARYRRDAHCFGKKLNYI